MNYEKRDPRGAHLLRLDRPQHTLGSKGCVFKSVQGLNHDGWAMGAYPPHVYPMPGKVIHNIKQIHIKSKKGIASDFKKEKEVDKQIASRFCAMID